MAKRKWTPGQQACINSRLGAVLVSAAAGSGKTSVLVERVIGLITDENHPVDIDRLLVVTFTKAAAAEMKQRLSARLGTLIAAQPDNRRLQRQQMLLPSATISTIDGFCTSFLREHFDQVGVPPRFGIAEGATATALRNEAVEEVLEVFYAAAQNGFLQLCNLINTSRDDDKMRQLILRTYDFIGAQPNPLQWLKTACTLPPDGPLSDTEWGKQIRTHTAEQLELLVQAAQKAALAVATVDGAEEYYAHLLSDIAALQNAVLAIRDASVDWDTCIRALSIAIPGDLPNAKGVDPSYKEPVKNAWKDVREELRKNLLPLFGKDEQSAWAAIRASEPSLTALCELVEAFAERYGAKKAEKQLLDFNDLEHLTLSALCDPQSGQPTPLAQELSERYAEILVDEYQDTNAVQDTMFRMLSGANNTSFFVGDVKQSIYGFRQAMPEIFIKRRAAAQPYEAGCGSPACITLRENFRSREEVTEIVNFVFNQLMTAEFCDIDYRAGEELNAANTTYPKLDTPTEVLIANNPFVASDISSERVEARLIAERIQELVQNGLVTEDEQLRPITYRDICILTRTRGPHTTALAEELKSHGIPAAVDVSTPFFSATETQQGLALLRTVDNPLRDVPLMALLVSPIGGFTVDELASVRVYAQKASQQKNPSLYACLLLAAQAENGEISNALCDRIQAFLQQLRRYRRLAVSLSADALFTRLAEETGLFAAVAAGGHSEQRLANLHQLEQFARQYEQNGYRGLSAFIRHIDRLESEQPDMPAAPLTTGGGNTVSIMTDHGSKGLEFPVVILTHLFGEFSRKSYVSPLLLHGEAGAAITDYDADTMLRADTVARNGVRLAIKRTVRAEELRVLYVAMTRAKEKLITVFVKQRLGARLQKLANAISDEDTVSTARMLNATSPGDWLLSAFLRHPDAVLLRGMAAQPDVPTLSCETPLLCRAYDAEALMAETEKPSAAPNTEVVNADATALIERMQFTYAYAPLARVPVKLAASDLAHRDRNADFVASRRPACMSEQGMTPAERGTAMHTFMQYAEYAAAKADVNAEADRLYEDGFLTAAQREVLDTACLQRFFDSDLYARMCAATAIWREYAFTVPLAATAIDPDLPAHLTQETLVVQGIADCVFEEDGQLVIVDYKTDRIRDPAQFIALYKKQLDIYKAALTRTLGKPVKETVLYAFHLNDVIHI